MTSHLVFISGGSSGIGLALARAVPFAGARVIGISRGGAEGLEHVAADLSDPAGWRTASACFEREIPGFAGERVVFVHAAGTLEPMGFAGEVDDDGYASQVLLNSASPQVLGHAFLRAASRTAARCDLLMIGSGAAHTVYQGWSAYCAGKAAVDHWVRTAGAEQERRGGRCRVLSIAPGVVATPMQEQIREMKADDFPDVERFIELHRDDELRDPDVVARELWDLLDRDLDNGAVLDLRDAAA
jgi:benzil reductase ((S)-benzoin forming)